MARKGTRRHSARTKSASRARGKAPARNRQARRPEAAAPVFFLVNVVPKALSGETNQDSEPHLAVNPANAAQIAATAFSPNPGGGAFGPVYISSDAGNTWKLNAIVPSLVGSATGTHDITTSFNTKGTRLYAGILSTRRSQMQFLRTDNPFSPTPMTILKGRLDADQPFTHATSIASGANAGKDRVYIGNNDFAAPGNRTETVDLSLDGGASSPAFTTVRIEKRGVAVGQDGPQSRPIAHRDGTVYAAFYRWRGLTGTFEENTLVITAADVVVVRDDKGGAADFASLVEPPAPAGDGRVGKRAVQGISYPFMFFGTPATGQQRIGGTISIAVDPKNSSTVYLAWGDAQPGSFQTIHVRRSIDRGVNWSPQDLLTIPNATNAALAIAEIVPVIDPSRGKARRGQVRSEAARIPPVTPPKIVIGLLCQQVSGTGPAQRWVTHLRRSFDGVNWSDLILANVPATAPAKGFDPYLGDYDHLVAVQNVLCGIFSANNTPDLANFPNGVKYQRNANFATRTLLNVDNQSPVAVSIDPFFFRVVN